ncbi:unnamed protein product, partial [Musa acuminata subsp. burmannicoides]
MESEAHSGCERICRAVSGISSLTCIWRRRWNQHLGRAIVGQKFHIEQDERRRTGWIQITTRTNAKGDRFRGSQIRRNPIFDRKDR